MRDVAGLLGTAREWLLPVPWPFVAANIVLALGAWVYIADLEPIGPPASTPNLLATGYVLGLLLVVAGYGRLGLPTVRRVWKRNAWISLTVGLFDVVFRPGLLFGELFATVTVHFLFTLALLGLAFLVLRRRQ